jgi:hypothetical protein
MAPEDRDRRFDKAIARHLRSAAASPDSANEAAGSPSEHDACPDMETLAAYHERSLLPEELNSWKAHIVGCVHCQGILAHLELTDDIPLDAAQGKEVLAMADREHSAAAQKFESLPKPVAGSTGQRASRLFRGTRWRWIAPAGAIAAGLLVWIATHEKESPRFPNSSEVKVAKNQEPAAPAPSMAAKLPAAAPPRQSTLSRSRAAADKMASSAAELGNREQHQVADLKGGVTLPEPPADEEGRLRKDRERDSSANWILKEKQADLDANAAAGAVQQRVEGQAANVQSQNQNNAYPAKVPGPGLLGQVETKKMKAAPAAPAPQAPPAEAASTYAAGAATEMVMVSNSHLLAAPGSTFVWRPGRAGLIEFSPDGGRSWIRQPSGVAVDLLTGAAPSDKVCWIVGRVGAILLTTDGGAHWKLLSSPVKEDLGGIRATDALHAIIWNSRGTKYFMTSDGGLTWQPAVHP